MIEHRPESGTLNLEPLTFKGEPLPPAQRASNVRVSWPPGPDAKADLAAVLRAANEGVLGPSDAFLLKRLGYQPAKEGARFGVVDFVHATTGNVVSLPSLRRAGEPRPQWPEGEEARFQRAVTEKGAYVHPDVAGIVKGHAKRLREFLSGLANPDEGQLSEGLRGFGYEQRPDTGGGLLFVRSVGAGMPDSVLRLPRLSAYPESPFLGPNRQALGVAIREGTSYTHPDLREEPPQPK